MYTPFKTTRPGAVIFQMNWLFFLLLLSSCLTSRAQAITDPQRMVPTTTHKQANPVEPLTQQTDEYSPLNNTPFFPGGPQALQTYLQNPALYPLAARRALREGTVRVRFRVTAMGELTQFWVVQSGGTLIDQAALGVVAGMPRWYPAHRNGTAVSCLYELPITFRLD